ncbi:universal stress protein [Mucilaginibacter sp. 14171R-50]|uniref:universal stress protein n=1 Tax=Mucilaginibacter sp. 14171R-50 TaxID=2703789 RepID=UPI00138D9EC6|nr:universal stress protein [Mucilaginibacter sp. 14171R-50]QHS55320.1 universal stress protein [Mucilaginibacter sp. 14171R-50]
MKKILVLTDFSDNARQAAEAAVPIAGKLHANIILFNTYVSEPIMSEYSGTPWPVEQLMWADQGKEKLKYLKEDLQELARQLPAGDHRPSIDDRHDMGSLGSQVKDLLQLEDIEMIIMGARSGKAWEHLLLGSDTSAVMEHTDRPVLIIPPGRPLKGLHKVTLATDFDRPDQKAVHYLTRIGRMFRFSLEIVHVSLWGEKPLNEQLKTSFKNHVAKYHFPAITYQEVAGKELIKRLNHLCAANSSDVLVLVHDRHNWLNRLFKQNQAQTLLDNQDLPVLIIPAAIADE